MSEPLLDKSENRIRRMFADIAPCYDFLNHLLSLNIDRRWRRRTVRLLSPIPPGPVLDVCTGTGDLALDLARATDSPVIGSDFCHEMLTRARDKSRDFDHSRVQYVEADTQALPFADDSFQLVTVAFGLRNVTNVERGLAAMARVTKPGGRVAILEFSRPRHWFFGRMYRFYFRFLLPLVGQIFSRSRDSAYRYLPASVLEFPDGEALAERMRGHGLANVEMHSFTLGIATLYIGTKK